MNKDRPNQKESIKNAVDRKVDTKSDKNVPPSETAQPLNHIQENTVEAEFKYFQKHSKVHDTVNSFINPKKKATESWMNKYAFISYGGSYLDGSSGNVSNDFVGEGSKQTPSMGLNVDINKWQNPSTKNIIEWSKTLGSNVPQLSTNDIVANAPTPSGKTEAVNSDGTPTGIDTENAYDSQTSGQGAIDAANFRKQQAEKTNSQTASGNTIKGIGNLEYTWKDFASCKYWSRIPNNRLITLRRFKLPVLDNGVIAGKDRLKAIMKKNRYNPDDYITSDSARALTYFGDKTGNNLNDFFGWTTGLNWTDDNGFGLENPKINATGLSNTGSNFLDNPISGSQIVNKFLGEPDRDWKSRITHALGLQQQLKKDKTSLLDFLRKESKENDPFSNGWQHRIYGPINVVTRTTRRTRGLKFQTTDMSIDFEYDLSQIGEMNSKLLMLDIISNMMVLTSNSGSFYGGDYRFHRQPTELKYPPTLLTELEKMATGTGDGEVNYSTIFKGYMELGKDFGKNLFEQGLKDSESILKSDLFNKIVDKFKEIDSEFVSDSGDTSGTQNNSPKSQNNFYDAGSDGAGKGLGKDGESAIANPGGGLSSLFNNKAFDFWSLLAQVPGELLDSIEKNANKDGSIIKTIITSGLFKEGYDIQKINANMMRINPLTTGEPIGEWHLTIGNPMNPVLMIGNLVCTGMTMKTGETLGPDDFPTSVKFTVSLKHGRDRDIGDLQSMMNLGQGRFYVPLDNNRSEEPWEYGFSTRNTGNDTSVLDPSTAGRVGPKTNAEGKVTNDGIIVDPAPQDLYTGSPVNKKSNIPKEGTTAGGTNIN